MHEDLPAFDGGVIEYMDDHHSGAPFIKIQNNFMAS
jgi:hypothetical protein